MTELNHKWRPPVFLAALDRLDAQHRARCLLNVPRHAHRTLTEQCEDIDRTEGAVAANRWMGERTREMRAAKPELATDEWELKASAQYCAQRAGKMSLAGAREYIKEKGLTLPVHPGMTAKSERARYASPDWWHGRLRREFPRRLENAMRDAGLVHRHRSPYVSVDGLERYQQHQRAQSRWLDDTEALCLDTGEILNLKDIAIHSQANPKNRRHELMTITRGLEDTAKKLGHSWLFAVVTAPSEFHAYNQDGSRNARFTLKTVRHSHRFHLRNWARVRAGMARARALYYGLRTVEAHHDATAHWNLLVFGPRDSLLLLEKLLRQRWLALAPNEPGAALHRVRVIHGDEQKGSAAGYVAKYISKGTDAHGIAEDETNESDLSGADATVRNVAWARIHGIRQFQFFGTPRSSIYREIRRLRRAVDVNSIERVRAASDGSSNFASYIEAQGGLEQARVAPLVTLDKDCPREIDHAGRTVLKLTRWGDLPTEKPVGVKCVENGRWKRCKTRTLAWRLQNRSLSLCSGARSDLGPVAITVRSSNSINEPTGWTNPRETGTYGPYDPIRIYGF